MRVLLPEDLHMLGDEVVHHHLMPNEPVRVNVVEGPKTSWDFERRRVGLWRGFGFERRALWGGIVVVGGVVVKVGKDWMNMLMIRVEMGFPIKKNTGYLVVHQCTHKQLISP